jgi:hypothetical protein
MAISGHSASATQILYGISGAGGVASDLYTINTATGAAALVGATGFSHVVSIDFHPTTGVLYGISNEDGQGNNSLITIDPATGAATFVANVGGDNWPDIGFDSNGTLYSWSESSPDRLNTINITNGVATEIGPNNLSTSNLGLDVDSLDNVYIKNDDGDIYTIDTGTGAETFVVNIGGDFQNALAFDMNDILYTLDRTGTDADLYTIDLITGNTTLIGGTGDQRMAALAFRPMAVQISEPGTLAIIGFGLAAFGFSRGFTRRRRAP